MSDQIAGFNSRIKKIKDPRNTYYVDPETGAFIPKRVSRKSITLAAERRKQKATFGGLVMCLVLGAMAVIAARYVRWEYLGIQEAESVASTLMMIDLGIAALAVFFLGGLLGQKSLKHMVFQLAGVGFALVTTHNLVWWMPETVEMVFGPAYIEQVRGVTEPGSIYLNGESIPVPLDALA